MKIENINLIDGTLSKRIIANEGMTFIRISDNIDFGNDVILGYRYRDNKGNLLSQKILELPEDFKEEPIKLDKV